jgi:hypothetical protein
VFETSTADIDGEATGNGSFVNISGNLSNNVACYDVLIDRNNDNMILVGTDFGLVVYHKRRYFLDLFFGRIR